MVNTDRRSLLACTGAAALFPGAAVASATAIADPNWIAMFNLGDERRAREWADARFSPAGLARRSAAEWGRLFAEQYERCGRLALIGSTANGDARRVSVVPTKQHVIQNVDARFDRDHPDLLFDLRQVVEPRPVPPMPAGILDRTALHEAIRQRMRVAIRNGDFSGSLQVGAPSGETAFALVHGWADRAAGRELADDTPINIGSADKSFTAILIAQLVEAGQLGFESRVADILPDYPGASAIREVTVRHLLSHRAGLGEPRGGIIAYSQAPYRAVAELLPAIAAVAPKFAPGARVDYSNEGFVLLGALVEHLAGKPYWDVLAERVYRPSSMIHSGHFTRPEILDRCARGYLYERDDLLLARGRRASMQELPWRGNSCGGGYSTAADVIRYFRALRAGKLISPAMAETLFGRSGEIYPGVGYGLGFARDEIGRSTLIGHSGGGGASGVGVGLRMVERTGWSFALLGNYDLPFAETITRDLCKLIAAQT